MTPGELLTEIMNKQGITQMSLADDSGLNQSMISLMRKNVKRINYKVLYVLRKKYKVDINKFFDL